MMALCNALRITLKLATLSSHVQGDVQEADVFTIISPDDAMDRDLPPILLLFRCCCSFLLRSSFTLTVHPGRGTTIFSSAQSEAREFVLLSPVYKQVCILISWKYEAM